MTSQICTCGHRREDHMIFRNGAKMGRCMNCPCKKFQPIYSPKKTGDK